MPRLPSTGSFWEGPQHSRTQPATHNSQEERKKEERKREGGEEKEGERERERERERALREDEGVATLSARLKAWLGPPTGRLEASPLILAGSSISAWSAEGPGGGRPLVLTSKASRRTCSQTCSGLARRARAAAPQHLQTHPRLPVVPAGTAPPAGDVHHPHTRPG